MSMWKMSGFLVVATRWWACFSLIPLSVCNFRSIWQSYQWFWREKHTQQQNHSGSIAQETFLWHLPSFILAPLFPYILGTRKEGGRMERSGRGGGWARFKWQRCTQTLANIYLNIISKKEKIWKKLWWAMGLRKLWREVFTFLWVCNMNLYWMYCNKVACTSPPHPPPLLVPTIIDMYLCSQH